MEQKLDKTKLMGLLEQISLEASKDGWKEPNSKRISPEVYGFSEQFLQNLPMEITQPEIAAEPDGEIEFEWCKNEKNFISISVGLGRLSYIGCNKSRNYKGTEKIKKYIPPQILNKIISLSDGK